MRLAEMVKHYLGETGLHCPPPPAGGAGVALAGRTSFDALILDLMLPDMDGLEVCRRIRAEAETPILMLTARGDARAGWLVLKVGAHVYRPNLSEPRELLARLKAILRRRTGQKSAD